MVNIKALHNPEDFKNQYLKDPEYCFCDNTSSTTFKKSGFFEIVRLEQIKALHSELKFNRIRREFFTVVYITKGFAEETIGYTDYSFSEGDMYFITANQLHSIQNWSDDIQGYHCIFDVDYFLLCLKHQIKLNQYPFFQTKKNPCIRLKNWEYEKRFNDLFSKLRDEYCCAKNFNDDLLIRLYLNVLLLEAERIFNENQVPLPANNVSRKELLIARFENLISTNYLIVKNVSEYADMLHIHPHYLNDISKEVCGKTAGQLIAERLIYDAKAHLVQTEFSILQISEKLNFKDQSYFSRFFKKHTGVSPVTFRAKHKH